MKKLVVSLVLLLAFLIFASCTTFRAEGLSSYIPQDYEVLGEFEESITAHKFFGSPAGATLFNIAQDSTKDAVSKIIKEEVQKLGGKGAIDIEIEYEATFLNMLAAGFTSSIWAPGKITVSGTVIR